MMTTSKRYASGTSVGVARTRDEIERTLTRYDATGFGYLTQGAQAVIVFEMRKRRIRFLLPLPHAEAFRFTERGYARSKSAQHEAWEQATRQ